MDELKLLIQFPAYAGIIVLWMWNRAQKAQIDGLQQRLDQESVEAKERMDRMQERQNKIFDRALRKTDLKDTDH